MRIQIIGLLTGKCLEYHNNLISDIESMFNETRVRAHKVPPHFTLKYSFNCDEKQLDSLIQIIKIFLCKIIPTKYTYGGFGTFDDNGKLVIYTKIKPSNEMQNVFEGFKSELNKLDWLSWESYEKGGVIFHATLASDIKTDINKIMRYLSGKERFYEEAFNNVALYRFTKEVNLMKEYELYKYLHIK